MRSDTTLLLPFGSVEGHGPHLPVGTDTILMEALLARANLPDTFVVAPAIEYSVVNYWRDDDGVTPVILDLDVARWRDTVTDVVRALAKLGFRHFVGFTWHDTVDFLSALRQVARTVEQQDSVTFDVLRTWIIAKRHAARLGKLVPQERHAALIETSAMLAIHPHLVGKFDNLNGTWIEEEAFGVHGTVRNPDGVYGDPRGADAAFGDTVLSAIAADVERLLTTESPRVRRRRSVRPLLDH